jgi:anti-sigma B factor antagonist
MPRFDMLVEPDETGVRIVLSGELDLGCAYTFDARLREIEERLPGSILIDLDDLSFIDSAGVGRILAAHKRARTSGRPLKLTRGSKTVQRVLAIAALDQVLEFAPSA